MDIEDVVIIGAGPAGIAAALQLKRHNIEPLLLERDDVGGLLKNANAVENYPGFPGGICGIELVELFREQVGEAGITVSFENVLELDYCDGLFTVKTVRRTIRSKFAVVASGTKPQDNLGFTVPEGISGRFLREVYPVKDLKNKTAAIIGAGDAAFDYALNLSKNNKVIVLNRSDRARCIPVLLERCNKSENITCYQNIIVRQIQEGDPQLLVKCARSGITGTDTEDGENNSVFFNADIVLAATGREPCLDFFSENLKKSFENLLDLNKLYIIGDVKNGLYRQTAICIGDGVLAAMIIDNTIGERVYEDTGKSRN